MRPLLLTVSSYPGWPAKAFSGFLTQAWRSLRATSHLVVEGGVCVKGVSGYECAGTLVCVCVCVVVGGVCAGGWVRLSVCFGGPCGGGWMLSEEGVRDL